MASPYVYNSQHFQGLGAGPLMFGGGKAYGTEGLFGTPMGSMNNPVGVTTPPVTTPTTTPTTIAPLAPKKVAPPKNVYNPYAGFQSGVYVAPKTTTATNVISSGNALDDFMKLFDKMLNPASNTSTVPVKTTGAALRF